MTTSDAISISSLLISFSALAYTYLSNTKKYELTSMYRNEVLEWYSNTICLLVTLRREAEISAGNAHQKNELLGKLSAQIEIGRFYFPNIDKGDGFGEEKPSAYRGYRNLMLDFLVFSYNLFSQPDAKKYLGHADILQRHFTSLMFDLLDPKRFLSETKKYTARSFSKDLSFEDFISEEPDIIERYL